MGYSYDESGQCYKCGIDTEVYCDECRRYVCNRVHSKRILVDSKHFIDICDECKKKLKPGAKIAGIRIKPEMLNRSWHSVRNIRT